MHISENYASIKLLVFLNLAIKIILSSSIQLTFLRSGRNVFYSTWVDFFVVDFVVLWHSKSPFLSLLWHCSAFFCAFRRKRKRNRKTTKTGTRTEAKTDTNTGTMTRTRRRRRKSRSGRTAKRKGKRSGDRLIETRTWQYHEWTILSASLWLVGPRSLVDDLVTGQHSSSDGLLIISTTVTAAIPYTRVSKELCHFLIVHIFTKC